ncbi:MAG TPA: hypothetical protein VGH86_00880 [Phenylobacterium sp.]
MTSRKVGRWVFASSLVVAAALASSAAADPCKAIPDRGPAPAYLSSGATFSGPVVYVGDGDSLCVAVGEGPQNWVEVRLADFYAPELPINRDPQPRPPSPALQWEGGPFAARITRATTE